jgi:hypothetical protein
MYLNEQGTISAVHVFNKYGKLKTIVTRGARLITNTEQIIVYKDKYITNTVDLGDTRFKLFQNAVKRERNITLAIDGVCIALAVVGGILIPNDKEQVGYVGMGVVGAAGLTFGINHLIVRLKKYRKLKRLLQ